MLVDGHRSQLKTLLRCLRRSGVGAPTIVLDFIHVSEYVWKAGMALHGEVHPKLEGWVSEHLLSILRGRSGYVAGGIRRSATRRGLEGKAREAVDRCANYLLKNAGYLKYDTYLAKGSPLPPVSSRGPAVTWSKIGWRSPGRAGLWRGPRRSYACVRCRPAETSTPIGTFTSGRSR